VRHWDPARLRGRLAVPDTGICGDTGGH
jgi:hypothetical protein